MNYIYAKWKWKKQCFEIIAQKISAKNMNNDLVFFRDEIKIFLISWFETRSRFVSSTSRASRRDREFVPSNLEFRDGTRFLKKYLVGIIDRNVLTLILEHLNAKNYLEIPTV